MADTVKKLRELASALVARAQIASRTGVTFDTKRDTYKVLGYSTVLSFDDFYQRYKRGGIAGRIVDTPASATWRYPPKIKNPITPNMTKFDREWEALQKRLRVFHFMEKADRLSGIGEYGILLIGAPGDLATPLPDKLSANEILFLSAFHAENAEIVEVESNTASPRFGLPKMYAVKIMSDITIGPKATTVKRVHHSRVIHVAEGTGENDIFGIPRMQRVWNYLDDLDKIVGGSAEAIWRTADRGIQFDLDKDATLDPDDETDFNDEIEEYMHGLRRYLRTQGVTANVLGGTIPNPQGAFQTVASLIAGTTGIPLRTLFGSERGQMASTQDERNFNGRMKERQELHAEPTMVRPFVDLLIDRGALPTANYVVDWPDLSTLTAREKADVAARVGQAVRNISAQGAQNSPMIVLEAEEFKREYLGIEAPEE